MGGSEKLGPRVYINITLELSDIPDRQTATAFISWLLQSELREVCTCEAVDVLIEDRAVRSGTQRPVLQGAREPKANVGVDLTADDLANLTIGRRSEFALMQQV